MTNEPNVTPSNDSSPSDVTPVSAPAPTPTLTTAAPPSEPPTPVAEPTPFDLAKLELPEGLTLTDDDKTQLAGLAEKFGLAHEPMSELTVLGAAIAQRTAESVQAQLVETWQTTTEGWKQEIVQQFGSEEKAIAEAGKFAHVLDKFGGEPLRKALDETGLGNHPALFSFFQKIGAVLTEGGPVGARQETPAPNDNVAAQLYPNSPELHRSN